MKLNNPHNNNETFTEEKFNFNCNKELCEWWLEEKNCCSIKSIASDLHEFIDNKIPRLKPQ